MILHRKFQKSTEIYIKIYRCITFSLIKNVHFVYRYLYPKKKGKKKAFLIIIIRHVIHLIIINK
jgi:hypothetical protein